MRRTITIEPVTRIEGHAKITLQLDDAGAVADARFHVTEFRGFEKFCIGRSFQEMPGITARICGICPVSHTLASAKAGDAILGVRIPPAAKLLRRLMNWAQIVQSHALSFFHLSGPDLLLGMESDPATRNIFGLMESHTDLARDGIRLRQFGQELIRLLGDRSVHPAWAIPGGVREPLSSSGRDTIARDLPEALLIATRALELGNKVLERHGREAAAYGNFDSMFLGMVGENGALEHYDGNLRLIDSSGKNVEECDPARFLPLIGEGEEVWTYLKFPYYKPAGYEQDRGMYRVGPLARLNVADFASTPLADRELRRFRQWGKGGRPVLQSFLYHQARLIEILHALESIQQALENPVLGEEHVRSHASVNHEEGIGVTEAPRGTLFHHYKVDENGLLTHVNLIIATGQNNRAMNRTVLQIAQAELRGQEITEGLLNRIEHGIRAYDPCLSCSTHATGSMPLDVELLDSQGRLLQHVQR
ncbi:nickel-dependent hydrogenase large subunit [Desulfurispirillum indicum S5]|uniref:Nickel-dependent hydrogenase large subunit n=1 Tax=Desulfurispirillum indicum (strain ATCC BAA-1389 / DSM 22839 / S5) TaxID=653733 RepID=E6W2H8_DESIS|nr:Ni/Fe hydrogenase subunit alpha [Desulfurispirillum indicum]ADU66728.1 nickel-dependent hydrogenase large subunit [Desulfurispirillum indicum S5]